MQPDFQAILRFLNMIVSINFYSLLGRFQLRRSIIFQRLTTALLIRLDAGCVLRDLAERFCLSQSE
jgi:hypothetical protein